MNDEADQDVKLLYVRMKLSIAYMYALAETRAFVTVVVVFGDQ